MNRPELLAPAGSFEALEAAINGGCDAVYVGLKNFGARAFANNFDEQEIVSAIKLCHTYGVKLYVTMNTLIHDSEVDEFIDKVRYLHKNGVDAILIQDFGMMMLVKKMFPNLEVHASTQFNNSSIDTLKLLKSIGVKRAVVSRELSIDEIKQMESVGIEIEAFVHGALCISYSGECLFSSMNGHRSANRGECVGCCRLPYKLEQNGKIIDDGYLLSTKELNTTTKIKDLLNSNICSLKIEGRMKSPSYVYLVTKFYRDLIDYDGDIDTGWYESRLGVLFNREFTLGHLFGKNNKEIMNTKSPNHIGRKIGKVIGFTKDKIKIKLDDSIHQEDGIRFLQSGKGFVVNFLYDKNMKLSNTVSDVCYVDNKIDLKSLDDISITSSKYLEKELLSYEKRRVSINFKAICKVGEPLTLIVEDGLNKVSSSSIVIEKAINSETDTDRIIKQLSKTGETIYKVDDIIIDKDDNIFIPIKELNELRREVLDLLTERRCEVKNFKERSVSFDKLNIVTTSYKTVLVDNEEDFINCVNNYDRVYITNLDVFNKYSSKYNHIYYSERSNMLNISFEERNLVSNMCIPVNDSIADYTFNVYNRFTVYYLHSLGYKTVTLSPELTYEEILRLQSEFVSTFGFYPNIEVIAKSRILLMTIKGDILKSHYNVNLIDLKGRKYPVKYEDGFTYIYNNIVTDKLELYKYNLENINIRTDKIFI